MAQMSRSEVRDQRARGAKRYALAVTCIVIAIGAAVVLLAVDYEVNRPQPTEGQECTMPDGTTLVLQTVTFGKSHHFSTARRRQIFSFVGPASSTGTISTMDDTIMFWMTRHDPSRQPLDFEWWLHCLAIDDDGCEFLDDSVGRDVLYTNGMRTSQSGSRPMDAIGPMQGATLDKIVVHSGVRPFRHSGSSFKLRVFDRQGTAVAEFNVADPSPAAGKYPVWNPEPLPATKYDGDVSIALKRLTATTIARAPGVSPNLKAIQLNPTLSIHQEGQSANVWTRTKITVSNALGHDSQLWDCPFCRGEAAWKLLVRVFRDETAPFSPAEQWTVPEVGLPERGSVEQRNESTDIDGVSLELLATGGSGRTTHFNVSAGNSNAWGYNSFVGPKQQQVLIETNYNNSGTTTVQCELPHIVLRATGLTENHYTPDLLVVDAAGNKVNAYGPLTHAMNSLFWILDVPEETKGLQLTFLVHRGRSAEFFVKPPQLEPTEIFQHADELARHGQWSEAAAEFAKALDAYPDNNWHWYRSITLQAQISDRARYRQQCARVLELFGDTEDPFLAERTAKACMLWPESDPPSDQVITLASIAVAKQPLSAWFLLVKGIGEYRAGRFEPCLEWLGKAHQASDNSVQSLALVDLFMALAHHRLGHADQARQHLSAATAAIDRAADQATPGDLGTSWHDIVMCQIMRREVESLIPATP
jgi:tetratricopeptide (TPR) repeat protein